MQTTRREFLGTTAAAAAIPAAGPWSNYEFTNWTGWAVEDLFLEQRFGGDLLNVRVGNVGAQAVMRGQTAAERAGAERAERATTREADAPRLADIVHEAGTGFAFPSTVNYLARDAGLDGERKAAAEAWAERLRNEERLPFPDFDETEWWETYNTGDYPAPGSPHSRRARERRSTKTPAE